MGGKTILAQIFIYFELFDLLSNATKSVAEPTPFCAKWEKRGKPEHE